MNKQGRGTTLRVKVFCSAAALWLTTTMAQASVIDAPHNDSNNIGCTSCHAYSLWWQYSPAQKQTNFVSLVDTMCFDCHTEGGSGPKILTHSSANIGSTLQGTWQRACSVCHNPHNQDQLEWANSETKPYLVTGTISAVVYDPVSKQTTITYADATSNSNWPAEGDTAATLDWANKSVANPGRGLILVQDTVATTMSYSIVAATTDTVTVKGEIKESMVDPNYTDPVTHKKNAATCNTFGLIYGNLIRNAINAKPVKFFDPSGGFVSAGGTNPTGICQVCHDATQHYSDSGLLPSGSDTHVGRDGLNCTTCHKHISGFKGEGHDNTSFTWAGNCATCHNPTGGEINITSAIHGGNCGLCHVSTAGGGARKDGDPANGVDGSALGGTNSSSCVDCHLTKLSLTEGTIHHQSAHGYAAAGNCTHCHDNAAGKLAADHSTVVALDDVCSTCHAATAGTATGLPVSPSENKLHDECTTCHNPDSTMRAAYGKAIAMPAHGGGCTACHGDYFANHQNIDHSARVAGTTNCTSCHTATAGTATGVTVDLADNKVHDACSTCHEANGALKAAYGKALAMPTGGGDCNACHGAYFVNHGNANHTARVTASTNCSGCHSATAGTATTVPVNPEDNKVHDACATCHNATTGALLEAYGKAIALPAGGGVCENCHGEYFSNHAAPNHATRVSASSNCISCHLSTPGTATGIPVSTSDNRVHDSCMTCHESNGSLRAPYGKAIAIPANGGSCMDCHGDYFMHHDKIGEHNSFLTKVTTSCLSCHDQAGGADIVTTIHNSACDKCHDPVTHAMVNGTTKAVKVSGVTYMIGDARKHTYGTTSSCATCHSYNPYVNMVANHPSANWTHADNIGDEVFCISCHAAEASPYTGAIADGTPEVHSSLNCNTCHNSSGGYVLKGSALNHTVGQPSSCSTCHIADKYYPANTTATGHTVPPAP